MKYIIELEKIEGTDLWKAKGCNTLVFDKNGIDNILKPYEKEEEVDWSKVEVDTLIEVSCNNKMWVKRYFARFEEGKIYAFADGATSKTAYGDIACWQYARLVKEYKNA